GVECLSFGRDHDTIALLPGAGVRFTPTQFKARELQCIERDEQVLRPLETETALSDSVVDEKIIEERWPYYAVITSKSVRGVVNTRRHSRRFVFTHTRRKRGDVVHQG